MRIAYQSTAADHLAVLHSQEAYDVATLDLMDPGRQHFRLTDIARQEQKVVRRQRFRKRKHRGFVGAGHQAEFDVAGISLGVARIGTLLTHVDLPPSQESSLGHSRLIALAPATRLT